MGHLINPIAFRLGHTRSWEDSWFIKGIYYPEFLHSILKVRQYIYYFWTTRFMEKSGFLLSHFYIYKFIKNLLIKIFLYNTDFEKYIYSFYARGVGIFSDSFYYRLKRMKKRKEPFCYQRYKPDLFFLLFLYHSYFTRKTLKKRINNKKGFIYLLKYCKKSKKVIYNIKNNFKKFDMEERLHLNNLYLNNLKDNKLNTFLKLSIDDKYLKNRNSLKIPAYENKIKLVSSKSLNMGFLDFLIYTFFKINMLEKSKEDKIRIQRSRRRVEMIINYLFKIKQWIFILRKFINLNIVLGEATRKYRNKRSLKNFIFFLIFFINIIRKIKKSSSRVNIRLRELNLKLIRLFILNRLLIKFAHFYGSFLSHIIYLLTNLNNLKFKFCFITNNSVNARFLTRYMGLKLRSKFPLFVVVNPLKKEFRKLSRKKKEKKNYLFYNFFSSKAYFGKKNIDFKKSYISMLKYLYNKYLEVFVVYYMDYKMLITFDIYIYYLMLKEKYKSQLLSLLVYWKKKFFKVFNNFIWNKEKKIILNNKWVNFLKLLLKKNIYIEYFLYKKKILFKLFMFIKNKLLINLFFSFGKNNVDSLVNIFFLLKGDIDTFFFFNSNYVWLTIYSFFYNYSLLNHSTLLSVNKDYLIMSVYFFKSFMFHLYVQYGFNKLISYLNINKKNYYFKMKELFSTSSYILGYKMSFKGRFTRKQRASSIWFHQGFVPLNTIKGCVDYSFFTIPLKNSAVSIKLWLYKNMNGIIWDSKFLSK